MKRHTTAFVALIVLTAFGEDAIQRLFDSTPAIPAHRPVPLFSPTPTPKPHSSHDGDDALCAL
jgi:hypothetical protein